MPNKIPQRAFRLRKDLPMLPAGAIFVLWELHAPHFVCLAWDGDGCQALEFMAWVGGTYKFPAQVIKHGEWFEEIANDDCRYNFL